MQMILWEGSSQGFYMHQTAETFEVRLRCIKVSLMIIDKHDM